MARRSLFSGGMGPLSCFRRVLSPLAVVTFVLSSCVTLLVLRAQSLARAAKARHEAQAPRSDAPPSAPLLGQVHATIADAILARNPFESATGPLGRAERDILRVTEPICPNADLYRVVLSEVPAWSFAEIATGARPTLLRLDNVLNGRRLIAIEADRVRMEGKEGVCVAYLQGKTSVSSPACVASGYKLGPPCVLRLRNTEFEIAGAMVDHVLEAQAELMRSARIVPEQDEHGTITGVRLFGIRPGSLMAALGFENGDALQTINGFDMTSPERSLEAYSRLRSVSDLRVGISRKGSKVFLDYHIV